MTPSPSDTTLRRRIRADWEKAGRPACGICTRPVLDGQKAYASQLVGTVIHALGSPAPGLSAYGKRPKECTTSVDVCRIPGFCPCPSVSAVSMVVAAHWSGLESVEVLTGGSPGCIRAAREAGLAVEYGETEQEWREGVTDALAYDPDEPVSDGPVRWMGPPQRLLVDVPGSIREGRIVAAVQ